MVLLRHSIASSCCFNDADVDSVFCIGRQQEDTEEEPDTPRDSRSPTRATAGTALSRAFSSGLVGRSASLDQPGTPTTSARGLNPSGELLD